MLRGVRGGVRLAALMATIAVACALAGCAAQRAPYGDVDSGLILEYRMPTDRALKYRTTNDAIQTLEMGAQSIVMKSSETTGFSVTSRGLDGSDHQLTVTLDEMAVSMETPEGDFTPDTSTLEGRSFEMELSVLGEEHDLTGNETIQYDLGPGGKQDATTGFQGMFPDMAGRPVVVGDGWTSDDEMLIGGSGTEMRIVVEAQNTLAGIETIDGLKCVKITAELTGTLSGEGQQGGADLSFEGDIEGTDTWYFAYEEGILVQETVEGRSVGVVTVTGPQEMSIPMTREFLIDTTLLR